MKVKKMANSSYDPNYYGEHRYDNETNHTSPDGLGSACLVLGIIAIVMAISCCLSWASIVPAIASVICGILAKDENGIRSGNTITGLVLSGISVVVFLITMSIFFFSFHKGDITINPGDNMPFEFQLPGQDGNGNPGHNQNNDNEQENGPL